MQYSRVQLRPIYRIQGVSVALTVGGITYPRPGNPPLKFLDKTSGISLGGPVEIETIRPAACAIVADILALGLTLDQLDDAALTMNSKDWVVTSTKPMTSPAGENDGEVYMFLEAR